MYSQHGCMCAQPCAALCHPMDWGPPASSVHGISQARTLDWVAISLSRGSSLPKDRTYVSCVSYIGRWILYQLHHLGKPIHSMKKSIKMELRLLMDNDPSLIHVLPILPVGGPCNRCAISLATSRFKLRRKVKVMTSALITFILIFLVFDDEKVRDFQNKKKKMSKVSGWNHQVLFSYLVSSSHREHESDTDATHIQCPLFSCYVSIPKGETTLKIEPRKDASLWIMI